MQLNCPTCRSDLSSFVRVLIRKIARGEAGIDNLTDVVIMKKETFDKIIAGKPAVNISNASESPADEPSKPKKQRKSRWADED